MNARPSIMALMALLMAGLAAAAPPRREVTAAAPPAAYPDADELAARLDSIAADPQVATDASGAIAAARVSLEQLREARRADRPSWSRTTERRIHTVQVEAEAARLEAMRVELERANERLQLDLARAEAAHARAELELQRLQAQIRAEEAERLRLAADAARMEGEQAVQDAEAARAEARQAKRIASAQKQADALARKEAELAAALQAPASKGAGAQVLVADDALFEDGSATIVRSGRAEVERLAAEIAKAPASRKARIEARGPNRTLAQRRAEALRLALREAGVADARMTVQAERSDRERIRIVLHGD